MEATFKYDLGSLLNEVNNEPELIPYFIKLDLLDGGIPIEIDPTRISDNLFGVTNGTISYSQTDKEIIVKWSK